MTEADLSKAEFFVEADSFARLELWSRFSEEGGRFTMHVPEYPRVKWEQDSVSFSVTVGWHGKYPVNVVFTGAWLNGKLVVFYDAVSQVTDSQMVEDWIKARANPRWDNGTRPVFTDAMNFHHCLQHIRGNR